MSGPLSKKGYRPVRSSTIGDLRHQVQVQTLDESVRDDSLQVVPTWVPGPTVWARVEPASGREFFQSDQMQADVTHRVFMRREVEVSVTPKMRLIWLTGPANNVLNVVTVLPTAGQANSLDLLCKEDI